MNFSHIPVVLVDRTLPLTVPSSPGPRDLSWRTGQPTHTNLRPAFFDAASRTRISRKYPETVESAVPLRPEYPDLMSALPERLSTKLFADTELVRLPADKVLFEAGDAGDVGGGRNRYWMAI